MTSPQLRMLSFVTAMLLGVISTAFAQDAKRFYRGGLDDKKAEAPNGASVKGRQKVLSAVFGSFD